MKLKRKIFFFTVEARNTRSLLTSVQLKQTLTALATLLGANPAPISSFTPSQDTTDIFGNADPSASPYFGEVAYIRKSALPGVRNKNTKTVKPLHLKPEEDLYEPSHFLLSDNGVLALEYNFHGPRSGTLEKYFNHLLGTNRSTQNTNVRIMPIIRQPGLDPLGQFDDIRKIRFRVATNWAKAIMQRDRSMAGMFSAAKETDGRFLTVAIDVGKKRSGSLGERAKTIINKIFDTAEGNYDNLKNLEVAGKTHEGKIDVLDLVEEHVMAQEEVVTEDDETKLIKKSSIKKALEDACEKWADEISEHTQSETHDR